MLHDHDVFWVLCHFTKQYTWRLRVSMGVPDGVTVPWLISRPIAFGVVKSMYLWLETFKMSPVGIKKESTSRKEWLEKHSVICDLAGRKIGKTLWPHKTWFPNGVCASINWASYLSMERTCDFTVSFEPPKFPSKFQYVCCVNASAWTLGEHHCRHIS